MRSTHETLYAFVYGTLKSTCWNHPTYMSGFDSMVPARMVGRLHVRQTGTPILEIPHEHRLIEGSGDLAADLAAHQRLLTDSPSDPPPQHNDQMLEVEGELYRFDRGIEALGRLDQLEDFNPGSRSLYERVLAPLSNTEVPHAWVYVIPRAQSPADYLEATNPAKWDAHTELGQRGWSHPRWDG